MMETDAKLNQLFSALNNRRSLGIKPTTKVAIISTPRCGSSLFCERLGSTSQLGEPREWFNRRYLQAYQAEMGGGKINLTGYINWLIEKTTSSNGVFSVNFHVNQYMDWKKNGVDLLRLDFDYIYRVYRADRLSQAYSYAKARLTDQWSASSTASVALDEGVPYPKVIKSLMDIAVQDQFYQTHLADQVRREYCYEIFCENDDPYREVLEDIGCQSVPLIAPERRVQRTSRDEKELTRIKNYIGVGYGSV